MAANEQTGQPVLVQRMIGAAKPDTNTYEGVEADGSATKQAILVVAIVALATGIGNSGREAPSGSWSASRQG